MAGKHSTVPQDSATGGFSCEIPERAQCGEAAVTIGSERDITFCIRKHVEQKAKLKSDFCLE
jgi:hypothetical protein